MAERRMFAKTIVTSDAFLDMPMSARCLYFTLGMFADDDGFVNSPKSIMRQVGATVDDMNILVSKRFVLVFDSGVIVIKHWRIHNYIQSDRYHPTKYQEEKDMLTFDENGSYSLPVEISTMYTECIQDVSEMDTEVRLGKDRLGKDRLGNSCGNNDYSTADGKKKQKKFTPPTVEEVALYINEQGFHINAEHFIDYYEANGWLVGRNKMKDWKATVRNWERRENKNTGKGVSNERLDELLDEWAKGD